MTIDDSKRPPCRAAILSPARVLIASAAALLTLVLPSAALAETPTLAPDSSFQPAHGEAIVRAFVNPAGESLTLCRVDYGADTGYGQSAPCDSLPPANNSSDPISVHLSGLTPGATYHYRFLATNGSGPIAEGDRVFEALQEPAAQECSNADKPGTAFLPDCRGWELVSPPDKNGGDIALTNWRTRVAADGSAFGYISLAGFGDVGSISIATDYLSERDPTSPTGWSTHALDPPQRSLPIGALFGSYEPRYLGDYSSDLDRGVFLAWSPLTDDPDVAAVPNLYRRTDLRTPGPGNYDLLSACPRCASTSTPLPVDPVLSFAWQPRLGGASPDLDHLSFESRRDLTGEVDPQPPTCDPSTELFEFLRELCRTRLYEWDHGALRLAGVLPDGSPADVSIAGAGAGHIFLTPHVVSDGSDSHTRVFFTQPTDGSGSTSSEKPEDFGGWFEQLAINQSFSGNLYMRLDGASTLQLNASERTDCAGDPGCGDNGEPDPAPQPFAPATFLDASSNGTRAFFMTGQALTDDAPAGALKIYMYDATKLASDPDKLTLVSRDQEPLDGNAAAIGVIGASDDGHTLYFAADGQLVQGGPQFEKDIYIWRDGQLDRVGPAPRFTEGIGENLGAATNWREFNTQSRVSADGRHLLFSSNTGKGLTGYEHGEACPLGNGLEGLCRELYSYDAKTDSLACLSCNPEGIAASADATNSFGAGKIGGAGGEPIRPHALSVDGSRAYFSSGEDLIGHDTNGKSDAYEYDTRTGELHLLSSGTDPSNSYFLATDDSGDNAFILTRERLVGWDRDGAYDVYDAHLGGGLPEPPPLIEACDGDGCHGSAPTPPAQPPTSSEALRGPGDPKPRRCPRGKRRVRRGGVVRCVRSKHPRAAAPHGGRSK